MIVSPLAGVPNRHYRITQRFGSDPETYAQFGMIGHNGIDFAPFWRGATDQKIYAPHEGYIVRVGNDPDGYGIHVEIQSLSYNTLGHQRHSTLAHFRDVSVKEGQWVGAMDFLGIMGDTGFSTGIHTHWTYKVKDKENKTLHYNNGFKGALDIAKNTRLWLDQSL